MSQKTGEDAESLQKKLDELGQKWTEVCQMSANWQQKLERTRDELSKRDDIQWDHMIIHYYRTVQCVDSSSAEMAG